MALLSSVGCGSSSWWAERAGHPKGPFSEPPELAEAAGSSHTRMNSVDLRLSQPMQSKNRGDYTVDVLGWGEEATEMKENQELRPSSLPLQEANCETAAADCRSVEPSFWVSSVPVYWAELSCQGLRWKPEVVQRKYREYVPEGRVVHFCTELQICLGHHCMLDPGHCKKTLLPQGVFSRRLFQPFCCCIPCVGTSCEVVRVKAIRARKSSLICSALVGPVNVYTSSSAETGGSCWVWIEHRIILKGQCQCKVFTKIMKLEHFCIYKIINTLVLSLNSLLWVVWNWTQIQHGFGPGFKVFIAKLFLVFF